MAITISAGGESLFVSEHAVERFIERCRPGLDADTAAAELSRLAEAVGVVTVERPRWMLGGEPATRYLMLGADVAFAMSTRTLTTCVTRGDRSASVLAERRRIRQERSEVRQRRRGAGTQGFATAQAAGRVGAGKRKRRKPGEGAE